MDRDFFSILSPQNIVKVLRPQGILQEKAALKFDRKFCYPLKGCFWPYQFFVQPLKSKNKRYTKNKKSGITRYEFEGTKIEFEIGEHDSYDGRNGKHKNSNAKPNKIT